MVSAAQATSAIALGGPQAVAAQRAPGAPLLEVRGLTHAFQGRSVLADLSFQVAPGEIFGLLGPNGSGKSTTLRVLTGLLLPHQGTLRIDGKAVAPGGRALRQRMGVVFQSGSLDARLTAIENLSLSAALYGIPPQVAAARIAELLEFTALADRAGDIVLNFSGGMKRRLELARALLHEPSLLVMDEPTTGLDERFFRQTWERIEALREQTGLTVLLTTHRAEEAARCDRVAVVDGGRIIAEGPPEALRQRIAGDVLKLQARDPEGLCAEITARLAITGRVVDGQIVIECQRGHELIPRLVEALPVGRIDSLSMHRPTLADVFVQLTGRSLGEESIVASKAKA